MATKKSIWVLFGILVMLVWVLGVTSQVGAETLNFKFYTYVTKAEKVPIGDVEDHTVGLSLRKHIYVFEDGEMATGTVVTTGDLIKMSGPFMTYTTINFTDGSNIFLKGQGTVGKIVSGSYTAAGETSETIKGTGRFQGIKGTLTRKAKFFPIEPGEPGPKGYGEGTITYTLPSK